MGSSSNSAWPAHSNRSESNRSGSIDAVEATRERDGVATEATEQAFLRDQFFRDGALTTRDSLRLSEPHPGVARSGSAAHGPLAAFASVAGALLASAAVVAFVVNFLPPPVQVALDERPAAAAVANADPEAPTDAPPRAAGVASPELPTSAETPAVPEANTATAPAAAPNPPAASPSLEKSTPGNAEQPAAPGAARPTVGASAPQPTPPPKPASPVPAAPQAASPNPAVRAPSRAASPLAPSPAKASPAPLPKANPGAVVSPSAPATGGSKPPPVSFPSN